MLLITLIMTYKLSLLSMKIQFPEYTFAKLGILQYLILFHIIFILSKKIKWIISHFIKRVYRPRFLELAGKRERRNLMSLSHYYEVNNFISCFCIFIRLIVVLYNLDFNCICFFFFSLKYGLIWPCI